MYRALLLSDTLVPSRHAGVPQIFSDIWRTSKLTHIIAAGNLGSSYVYRSLCSLVGADHVHVVKGNEDPAVFLAGGGKVKPPEWAAVSLGCLKLALVHSGPQTADDTRRAVQRTLGTCDVIVMGGGASPCAEEVAGTYILRPGHATGDAPTFMLLTWSDKTQAVLYLYSLTDGRVDVEQTELTCTV
ncbi:MAG: uncharacterized protein KVP18_001509 [Porospora cf. gigantea A]|uniref:uncharacterized protein n=1 Tax=Porospora cf. gigantea A TaxID=2853593 RepID=UPI0035597DE0|nr:MAG: hypothetical protein KVP18_001509 [Porospora cf. gigantea A]